jgi:hypothetical protein
LGCPRRREKDHRPNQLSSRRHRFLPLGRPPICRDDTSVRVTGQCHSGRYPPRTTTSSEESRLNVVLLTYSRQRVAHRPNHQSPCRSTLSLFTPFPPDDEPRRRSPRTRFRPMTCD